MTEVKTFKIEQKFNGTEDLYKWLRENVDLIEELTKLQIQSPLRNRMICLTAKEKITERQILFFTSKSEFHNALGEMIISAGTFDIDIVVFFTPKLTNAHLEPLNWLNKICASDYQIIVIQAEF